MSFTTNMQGKNNHTSQLFGFGYKFYPAIVKSTKGSSMYEAPANAGFRRRAYHMQSYLTLLNQKEIKKKYYHNK